MKRLTLSIVAIILILHLPAGAVTWPAYENGIRSMGTVSGLLTSGDLVVFNLVTPQGTYLYYECANAHARGCDTFNNGETVLVSGHVESFIEPGCAPDAPHPRLVPNAVSVCVVVGGSWSCTLKTP